MRKTQNQAKGPSLREIEILARRAGVILRSGFGSTKEVARKGTIDLVTEMDRRTEAFILKAIQARYPEHGILAEESGKHGQNSRYNWYVDPLDGTVNYAHGIPIFCVSIAFEEYGELQLGAVYDPMQDECFSAERGKGAWLNGHRLQVSGTMDLASSLLTTGFPYDVWSASENNLDYYAQFSLSTQGVRRLGSAALDLCYVAAGRFDAYWELEIHPWDIAAGALIAEEAGAVVTDVNGGMDYLSKSPSILVANAHIHPSMLEILEE
jgi:myo-inositol-1(or 4)-monophosphatase